MHMPDDVRYFVLEEILFTLVFFVTNESKIRQHENKKKEYIATVCRQKDENRKANRKD